ncbi:hypothetical protein C2S52_021362 [Perilla frutescens var. hirtella]|nr:hypothetical protein C2S52_021362 [Perilla frutescens var. hirtella]
MTDKYDVSGHKWLNNMYKIRREWAITFSNDKFSTGLLATSRSESTNSALKKVGSSTITLYDFVLNFEKILNSWHTSESYEDAHCQQGKPSSVLQDNPLLSQVADIYTLNIYKIFELELGVVKYSVVVTSLRLWESYGKHALKVLNLMGVDVIHECYIKRRLMKNAKNRVLDEVGGTVRTCDDTSDSVFVNQIMRLAYDLSMWCKGKKDAKDILRANIEVARCQLDTLFEELYIDAPCNAFDAENDVFVCNPQCAKIRGVTNSHIKRH